MGSLLVKYRTNKLEKECTDRRASVKSYGNAIANKIFQRISEIEAADNVEMMVQFNIGRCHHLKGNKLGQFAVDLVHPHRMVFVEDNDGEVNIVKVIEIKDYH